jgi:hypothetical protein
LDFAQHLTIHPADVRLKYQYSRVVPLIAVLVLFAVSRASAQTAGDESLDEVNKQLSNPISSIWALQLQENTYWLSKPERNVVNVQFQPVLPLALTDDWNLITRPVLQVMNSSPYVNKSGNLHRVIGFGDTILATLLSPSPKLAGPWLLGAGPSFIFSTRQQLPAWTKQVAVGTDRRIRLPGWQMDRRSISATMVLRRRPRPTDC